MVGPRPGKAQIQNKPANLPLFMSLSWPPLHSQSAALVEEANPAVIPPIGASAESIIPGLANQGTGVMASGIGLLRGRPRKTGQFGFTATL
jgi:hypothetical protein